MVAKNDYYSCLLKKISYLLHMVIEQLSSTTIDLGAMPSTAGSCLHISAIRTLILSKTING